MPLLRAFVLMLAVSLGLTVLVGPSPAAAAPDVLPVAHWQRLFDAQEASLWSTSTKQAQSGDSWQHYNMAYAVDAYGSMFEATGDPRYLDKGLRLLEDVQRTARPSAQITVSRFRDSHLGWPGLTHPSNADDEHALYEFFMWRYGFRVLRLADEAPVSTSLKTRAASVYRFAEANVWGKWWARGVNSHVYRSVTHITAHAAFSALSVEALSDDAVRRTQARTVIDAFDAKGVPGPGKGFSMRMQLRDNPRHPAAYWWNYNWGAASMPGSDVAHGGAVIAYISESNSRGGPWTQADMRRFALTLTEVVMPRAANVDGSGSGTGWLADGWSRLGRHSAAAQTRLESHSVQGQPQYRANMAASARLLLAPPESPGAPTLSPAPSPTPVTPAPVTPAPSTAPVPLPSVAYTVTNQNAPTGTQAAVIAGTVTPARRGAPVTLQQLSSGAWRNVGSATLTSSSGFRFTPGTGTAPGRFTYRVHAPATATAAAVSSDSIVIVRS